AEGFQRRCASPSFAGLACGHTGLGGEVGFANNGAGRAGVAFQPVAELFVHCRVDVAAGFGVTQFGFGLAFELWFGQLHGDDGGETFTNVVTGEVFVFIAQDLVFAGVAVDEGGQGATEAFFVGTTLVGVDRVGVGVYRFGVGGGPLHGHFNRHAQLGVFAFKGDDIVVDQFGALGFIQVGDVVQQPVFVHVVHTTNRGFWLCCLDAVFCLNFGFCIGQRFGDGFTGDLIGRAGRFHGGF